MIDGIPIASVRDNIRRELKIGRYSEHVVFNPEDPSGYYSLDLSKEVDRSVGRTLQSFEKKSSGKNIRICRHNGRDFDLFECGEVSLAESRVPDGFRLKLIPEMLNFEEAVAVDWKSPADGSDRSGDWIALMSIDSPDLEPPNALSSWEEIDIRFPSYRVMTDGRLVGNATLRAGERADLRGSGQGKFEARYFQKKERKPPAPPEKADSMKKQSATPRFSPDDYICVARSNQIFIEKKGTKIDKEIPSDGTMEIVYVSYDPLAITLRKSSDDQFDSLKHEIASEIYDDARKFVLQSGANAFYFTCSQYAELFSEFFRSLNDSSAVVLSYSWIVQMAVIAFARCTDAVNYGDVLKSLPSDSVRERVRQMLNLKDEPSQPERKPETV